MEVNASIPSLVPRFFYADITQIAEHFAEDATAPGPTVTDDDRLSEITRLPSPPSTKGALVVGDPPTAHEETASSEARRVLPAGSTRRLTVSPTVA